MSPIAPRNKVNWLLVFVPIAAPLG